MQSDTRGNVPDPILRQRLEQAAEGLVYSSEGDYPFEFFFLPMNGSEELLDEQRFAALVGAPPDTPVRLNTLDRFLSNHIETSDPWDVETQRIRPRYERLKALLQENLRDVCVFRVGEIQIRCYIAGWDEQGNLTGLATTAIET
jgi:hypothetical protein